MDPGKRFTFDSLDESGPATITSDFVLASEGGGTKIERTMTFVKPPGFQGVMWPVIFPMFVKPAIQKNLNELKKLVESPSADGAAS